MQHNKDLSPWNYYQENFNRLFGNLPNSNNQNQPEKEEENDQAQ